MSIFRICVPFFRIRILIGALLGIALAVYHSFTFQYGTIFCFRSTEAGVAFALYNLFFNDLLPIKDRSLFFFGVLRPIGPVKEGVFTESKG